ncbi:hypothetical protein P4O66_009171 [Electrophorus voltai]|uniref:Uncharacterized protein n=1 Tax=Electrophorus voltai TaxID=2609070 RepID=A0AAD8ZBJ5_9TELE|nr:hypothetical protein P4O66_009171 [Electrophorus voltai]
MGAFFDHRKLHISQDLHAAPNRSTPLRDHPQPDPSREGESGRRRRLPQLFSRPVVGSSAEPLRPFLLPPSAPALSLLQLDHEPALIWLLRRRNRAWRHGRGSTLLLREVRRRASMAQTSHEQGSAGTADPDEDSPNMIVYRKYQSSVAKISTACGDGVNSAQPVVMGSIQHGLW